MIRDSKTMRTRWPSPSGWDVFWASMNVMDAMSRWLTQLSWVEFMTSDDDSRRTKIATHNLKLREEDVVDRMDDLYVAYGLWQDDVGGSDGE